MMILHLFAVASVFVELCLAAPSGQMLPSAEQGVEPPPQPKFGLLEWSKGTESTSVAGNSFLLISSNMNANDVSKKIVQTDNGFHLDITCNVFGAIGISIEWNGGTSKFQKNFQKRVPANKATITATAGSGSPYLDCFVVPAAASTTTTKAPATTTKAPVTTTKTPGGTCSVSTKNTCKCGKQSLASRIVGGTNAVLGEAPWQIGLMFNTKTGYYGISCGGTIVSPWHVVTAAHCTVYDEQHVGKYAVVYGTLNNGIQPSIEVETVYDHPDYNKKTLANDISVLKLVKSLPFSANVAPACLPDPSVNYAGKDALLTGWGKTAYFNGQQPQILQKLVLPIATHAACSAKWGTQVNEKTQVCSAGHPTKGTFEGDSGGPMVALNKGSYDLVGAVSFGSDRSKGTEDMPVVFTRVSAYLSWINGIICQTSSDYYCSK